MYVCAKILADPDHEPLLLKLNEMVGDKKLINNEFRPIGELIQIAIIVFFFNRDSSLILIWINYTVKCLLS